MDPTKSTAGTVLAGFGTADITPWEGVHLGGAAYGEYRPARFVRHKLYAKASVYRDAGGNTVCIVGLDTICVKKPYADQIKQAVMTEFGLPYGAIMVFAIQSHLEFVEFVVPWSSWKFLICLQIESPQCAGVIMCTVMQSRAE